MIDASTQGFMKLLFAVIFAVVLGGCATVQQYTISVPFDRTQAAALMLAGNNTIHGNAFMRQKGGGVVSCAGSTVTLVPATAYADERTGALYGRGDSGMTRKSFQFQPDYPEYRTLTKTTTCDSSGNFQFNDVADGDFFVVTTVSWTAGAYNVQGGSLMHKVGRSRYAEGSLTSRRIHDLGRPL